jgi:hypothetical protein
MCQLFRDGTINLMLHMFHVTDTKVVLIVRCSYLRMSSTDAR